jgi:glycogen operon protein
MTQQNTDMLRFVQLMIALRKRHPAIMRRRFLTGKLVHGRDIPEIQWHGIEINKPLWDDPEAKILAFTLAGLENGEPDLHVAMNMSDQSVSLELPVIAGRSWCLALDTSLKSPQDIVQPQDQKPVRENVYPLDSRTVVVFENG